MYGELWNDVEPQGKYSEGNYKLMNISKQEMRKEFLQKRNALSKEEQVTKSKAILEKLLGCEEYKKAEWIFSYINIGSEVKTVSFIKRAWADGKKVAVPIAKKSRCMYFIEITSFKGTKRTKLGTIEPDVSIEKQVIPTPDTLFIVPGSMFDEERNRCGYGGGYYDTYINENKILNTIGICYDCQVSKKIPTEEFDKKLNKIITEKREI